MNRALIYAALLVGAPPAWAADDALLVGLQHADAAGLAALKQAPGVRWWVEAGDVLVLAGDAGAMRDALPAAAILRDLGTLDAGELALHARGCGDSLTPIAEPLILYRGPSYDLVRRPKSFSPLSKLRDAVSIAHLGAPEWLPVERNSTVARLHRFDRAKGTLAANATVEAVVARVDAARWFTTVETLAAWDRSSYSPELTNARQWIAGEFAGLGLSVSEPFFNFTYSGVPATVANVIGRIDGVQFPEQWLVVGGHYDSRNNINGAASPSNTPGADDNASGCSGVIEAARAIVRYRPLRTVLFMCYSGEEQGLHGSAAHVNALSGAGDLSRVQAMLNMDMIGWSPDATIGVSLGSLAGAANTQLVNLVADSAATYVPELTSVTTTFSTCCSDHMPYLNAGRPALMSIHRGTTSYPHYHQSSDTPANLGPQAQVVGGAIVKMNVAALAHLAGLDLIFADGNEDDDEAVNGIADDRAPVRPMLRPFDRPSM